MVRANEKGRGIHRSHRCFSTHIIPGGRKGGKSGGSNRAITVYAIVCHYLESYQYCTTASGWKEKSFPRSHAFLTLRFCHLWRIVLYFISKTREASIARWAARQFYDGRFVRSLCLSSSLFLASSLLVCIFKMFTSRLRDSRSRSFFFFFEGRSDTLQHVAQSALKQFATYAQ